MELIEIIEFSLSIFLIIAIVFITISYTVFKIKDRSRIKPHLRVNVPKPFVGILNDKIDVKVNKNMGKKSIEENQFNKIVLVKLPIQNKFTIINENVAIDNLIKLDFRKENPRYRLNANGEKDNNYDFYASPDAKTPKLKFVTR
jgi:hypothetical protein